MTRINTPSAIRSEIKTLTFRLMSVGLVIDQNLPCVIKKGRETDVFWNTQTSISPALKKNSNYNKIYESIIENRNFNLLLDDGAIIQMSYRFSGTKLISHRLVFLPNPLQYQNDNEEELSSPDEDDIDQENLISLNLFNHNIIPVRFDYKELGHQNVKHPMSHLHLGVFQECRIPLCSPISPNVFIDFILRNFYSDKFYENLLSCDLKFSKDFLVTITPEEEKIIHLNFKI